jgi:carbon monoxide dehydrogenase subunit G
MEFTGRYAISAAPETVWAALNDTTTLKACIPGCERLERVGAHRFDAVATLRIGPVRATFRAAIEQSELDPPRRCVLRGEGQGGVAGFARGEAEVILERVADTTVLAYTAKATIGGKLAQIGQRLVDGAAKQIADDFFRRFAAQLAVLPIEIEPGRPVSEPLPETPPAAETPVAAASDGREGLAPEIWVIGLIAVVAILLVLFGVAL